MKASVTISRRSDATIAIAIKDEASRERVCEVKLSLEDFAKALTGQGELSGDVRYGKLAVVGKRKVRESRSVAVSKPYPSFHLNKELAEAELLEACQEEGWNVDYYLGSQNSIVNNQDNTYTINYSVYKYVDIEE